MIRRRLMVVSADDLWPLVQKLSREERVRLARMTLASTALAGDDTDAERYRAAPTRNGEFDEQEADPLGWDAEGWDEWS